MAWGKNLLDKRNRELLFSVSKHIGTYQGLGEGTIRNFTGFSDGHKALIKTLDSNRFNIVTQDRQSGLSTILAMHIAIALMTEPNYNILIVGRYMSERENLLDNVCRNLHVFNHQYSVRGSGNIQLPNNSKLVLVSTGTALTGFPVNLSVILNVNDSYGHGEFSDCVTANILGMRNDESRMIVTAMGDSNNIEFKYFYEDSIAGHNAFVRFHSDFFDNPNNSEDDLNRIRAINPNIYVRGNYILD